MSSIRTRTRGMGSPLIFFIYMLTLLKRLKEIVYFTFIFVLIFLKKVHHIFILFLIIVLSYKII